MYRARSEALRREAWAWFEKKLAWNALVRSPACPRPMPPPPAEFRGIPPLDSPPGPLWPRPTLPESADDLVFLISRFEVFRDELAAEAGGEEVPDFWEVLKKWEAMPRERRRDYFEITGLLHERAWKAHHERMMAKKAAADAADAAHVGPASTYS